MLAGQRIADAGAAHDAILKVEFWLRSALDYLAGTAFRMPPLRRRSIGAAEIQSGWQEGKKSAPICANPRSGRIGEAGGLIRDSLPPLQDIYIIHLQFITLAAVDGFR